jgi:hypothetical protein
MKRGVLFEQLVEQIQREGFASRQDAYEEIKHLIHEARFQDEVDKLLAPRKLQHTPAWIQEWNTCWYTEHWRYNKCLCFEDYGHAFVCVAPELSDMFVIFYRAKKVLEPSVKLPEKDQCMSFYVYFSAKKKKLLLLGNSSGNVSKYWRQPEQMKLKPEAAELVEDVLQWWAAEKEEEKI